MKDIAHELSTYLKELPANQKDLLILESLTLSKLPSPKPTTAPPPLPTPAPPRQEPIVVKEEDVKPTFLTEKPALAPTLTANEMEAIYKKIAPHVALSNAPPNDAIAKQIRAASTKRSQLPEIPIFSDTENREFFTKLASAITQHFGKAELLSINEFEEKNLWKPLLKEAKIRLILLPQTLLKHSPNLLTLIKEYPGRLLKSVEKIPLLAIDDLRDTPVRKKEIWALLQKFFQ